MKKQLVYALTYLTLIMASCRLQAAAKCPAGQSYTCAAPSGKCKCCPAGQRMALNLKTGKPGCFEENKTMKKPDGSGYIACPNIKPSCDGYNCGCCPAGQRMAVNINTVKLGCFEKKNTIEKPDGSGYIACPNGKPSCPGGICKCCPAGKSYTTTLDGNGKVQGKCCKANEHAAIAQEGWKIICCNKNNIHSSGEIYLCSTAKKAMAQYLARFRK